MYGKGVARGYAIGRAVVMGAAALEVAHYRIAPEDIAAESSRLTQALADAQQELLLLADTLPADAPRELGAMLNVHSLLLGDPLLAEQTLALIAERHYNAEWALTTQGQILGQQFDAMEDEYLRERGADVRQVIERVLHVLAGTSAMLPDMGHVDGDEALIVVAHDISPADMLRLRGGRFAAFVTDLGGPTSHTAIVARSMGVPAVVALGNVRELVRDGDTLIIDGASGAVVVNPSPRILQEYRRRQSAYADERAELSLLRDVPSVTLDGIDVVLHANIELPEEAALAGVRRARHRPVPQRVPVHGPRGPAGRGRAVRSLCLGGEGNGGPSRHHPHAGHRRGQDAGRRGHGGHQPALGQRAIRYCLARPEMFATQLRAILRASAHGPVRLLIPMIAHMHEVVATKAAIEAARRELDARGRPMRPIWKWAPWSRCRPSPSPSSLLPRRWIFFPSAPTT